LNLHFGPILSSLRRNHTGALLVSLQIAIALAVLVNAVYVVKQRVEKIGRPTGIDVENIFTIANAGFTPRYNLEAALREDLAYLRGLDGVIAATPSSGIPLSGSGSSTGLSPQPPPVPPSADGINYFEMDEQGLQALGVKLTAGRAFRPDEILPPVSAQNVSDFVPQLIVTKMLADKLFPNENALGRTVYTAIGQQATIIGIVERMHGSWTDSTTLGELFIKPRVPYTFGGPVFYIVRVKPGMLDATMRLAEEHLTASNADRVIKWVRPMELFRRKSYLADRNMGIFLVTVTALLLAITCIGIFGLATFNVSTRTKQIGTRRAVGARRIDIVCFFMVENWIITTAGVVAGCAIALGVGFWLSTQFEMPRLDLLYLTGGVLLLWMIGLLAAWQPARRASRVSPAIATRSV
jgi:putative ABC transport system permease protein